MDRITSEELLGFLDKWDAAHEAGDAARMAALCTTDVVLDESGRDPVRGRDDVEEFLGSLHLARGGEEGRSYERKGVFVSADATSAAIVYRTLIRSRGDEEDRVLDAVDIFQFRDGLVAHWTAFIRNPDWIGDELP